MIRFASVGTSGISAQLIAASRRVSGVEFAVAYSRDAERAAAFAQANRIPTSDSDYARLLSSDEIDAVYIATPNSVHFGQALAALRAGKHVLVEKPATPDAATFQQLMDEAERQGVVLLEAMRNVYDPGMAAIADLMGSLGTLRQASLSFCQRSSRYDAYLRGENFSVFDPTLAGGTLLDLGVYCLSAAVKLFGAPISIVGRSVQLRTGVDGVGIALLEYPGMVVEVSYSKASNSARPSEIQGEFGTLLIDHIANPRHLTLEPLGAAAIDHVIDKPEGDLGNLQYAVARFVALVAGEDDGRADLERTLQTLRLTDTLRKD